ncbi:WbqC family protein [Mesorhizobium sp. M1406]|uniref:WbqC family protein n=1 Tax=Mesorhizobium sp. M1406 TaxID=2957099 RepID=UPI003335F57B
MPASKAAGDPRRVSDKRIAILQSAYIPWKGYFDIIGSVDIFVVYDDVQYPQKSHWHNRNLIKTQHGPKWLTVPVSKADGSFQTIDAMQLPLPFLNKHWQSIHNAYARAPHYKSFGPKLEALYKAAAAFTHLSELNLYFLAALTSQLGFDTQFVQSRDLAAGGAKTDRLLGICLELGATRYLSGPAAKAYLETDKFDAANVQVEWMDYSGYPAYPQLHGNFDPAVSVIDLLFNVGDNAIDFMKAPLPRT